MSKYPLTESLGVETFDVVIHGTLPGDLVAQVVKVVRAADLERVLSQAPVVNAYVGDDNPYPHVHSQWSLRDPAAVSTHTARLLCVQPIVRDTAESLLRELCDKCERLGLRAPEIDRARKLLGEG